MSRWIRYLGLLTPLAGAASPLHVLNAALLPLLGGLIYGYFTERRRYVALSPLAAMVPVAAVLLYYVAVDAVRLSRYLSVFPPHRGSLGSAVAPLLRPGGGRGISPASKTLIDKK